LRCSTVARCQIANRLRRGVKKHRHGARRRELSGLGEAPEHCKPSPASFCYARGEFARICCDGQIIARLQIFVTRRTATVLPVTFSVVRPISSNR
jgi:hypothetical protein